MQNIINRSKYRICISSVQQLNEDSIKFSLLTQTWRVVKSSQTKSLHNVFGTIQLSYEQHAQSTVCFH